ncbi:non-ribosomal peptide synthetase [Myxococcus stipitatus DSM 14675]|uniref:Non-ribosomal peptide synthetase n=1 Tax=Myxococcus stipitatus (strain DSM 14675 / JCM 12634 / Mx s8) TaxID=1278073 RepID=L7UAE1_MYXSD|nr:non-ribosomal peptide synthetase [Myxococcus stipitatus]AGC43404.1 non-ribosomal peptide synthetase [Myxococcus stipitatus DSM 14675]
MTAESFVFPVSFAQQRLWFLHLLQPENPSYNIAGAVRLGGHLDVDALQRSFDALVERHESLRTTFAQEDGNPVQVIAPEGRAPITRVDLCDAPEAEREEHARRLATEECRRPFDLMRGPLLRLRLFRLTPTEHLLVMTLHHIISDGGSLGILVHEMSRLYDAFRAGREPDLEPLPLQYADYTQWQRDWLETPGTLDAHLTYWKQKLAGASVLQLPTDRPRPALQSQRGAALPIHLPRPLVEALRTLGQRERATLFMAVLAAWQGLLSRYTHQTDIVVGAPQNNRANIQTEGLIGFFVNTLVLRTDLSGNPTFRELLARVREVLLEAHAHQDLPFEQLMEQVQPERNLSYTPLFQAALNLQAASPRELTLPGLTLKTVEFETGTSKFDVTLDLQEGQDGLRGVLEYNTDLFDRATMERLRGHLLSLLDGVTRAPDLRLDAWPLLTAPERHQLLETWPALKPFPTEGSLPQRFEAQVRQRPDAIAVVSEKERITYAELDRRANQLAHALRARGVERETLVGLCVERSAATVVGILGILKAGAAYVPLDPTYPADRLAYMVTDSQMPVAITQRHLAERLPTDGVSLLVLEDAAEDLARQPTTSPDVPISEAGLAYVIYTSGSTGRPKGSLLPHGNVLRLFDATEAWFHFDASDVWTLFHSYAFDFSVWELWGALLYGGRLVVVPYLTSRSPDAFLQLLHDERVTVLNQTPAAFRQLIQAEERLESKSLPLALRSVIFGGEALEPATLVPWFQRHGDARPQLVNMYGITETTVHVTYRPMTAAEAAHTQQSPIGLAIPDLQLYVLDSRMEPVPIGVTGEIHVGGAGLARGYLGQSGLTAQRFVPHPFSHVPGARLYRTGDLARFTPDGQLEYLGRIDDQVKIRGFRIELGEIQVVLSLHPAVREALVLVREETPGARSLVAYLATGDHAPPSVADLRQFLLARLPDYMVPSAFVLMERFPLTANGKVDRKALPAPSRERAEPARYVAPRNDAEATLCAIWSEVLGVPRVGIQDNFFALGGDSILSIRVLTLARRKGLDFTLQQLFQHQTVAALMDAAGATREQPVREEFPRTEPFSLLTEEDRAKLPPGIEDAYPLARIQAGMLYHMQLAPDSNVYHNTDTFHLRLQTPVDTVMFEEAMRVVVARHPVLRTSFDMTTYSEPLQLVHREATLSMKVVDLRHLSDAEQEAAIRQLLVDERHTPFDLAVPPLLRFFIHLRGEQSFQFTLTECHAIIDGWSLHSTLVEIFNHHHALVNGQTPPPELPATMTYRDFVAMERRVIESEPHQRFWRDQLAGGSVMRLPRWRRAPASETPRIATVKVPLSREVHDGLLALTRAEGVPFKSILVAAHLKVMGLMSGQDDVITGMGVNSRPEEGDGSRLRAIFLNTLPFRLRLAPGSWTSLVRAAFDAERALYPFRRFPMADIQRQWGREPLYEVMFNYMHFHVLHELAGTLSQVETLGMIRAEGTNATLAVHFQTEPHTQELTLELDYNAVELEHVQVEQVGAAFQRVLSALAFHADQPHHTTSALPPEEQRRLLVDWNATAAPFSTDATFRALFEARALAHPDAVAAVEGTRTLTYGELDARANQVAWQLRSMGVGPERLVALHLDRSLELLIGLLAATKAGAGWLPLDPAYPSERRAFMLSDSRAEVLLTTSHFAPELSSVGLRTVLLDGPRDAHPGLATGALPPTPNGDALAYVIYTSGSTGLPKGTLVTQRGLVHYLDWARREYQVTQGQSAPVHTSIAFDATLTSLLTPLCAGGTVHLLPSGQELEALAVSLREHRHGLVKLTPAHLQVLSNLLPEQALASLEGTFVVGGEALPAATVELWRRQAPRVRLVNEYGPTETVVGCSIHDVSATGLVDGVVPIGRPIANTEMYVLDAQLQPVPVGVVGELYIGGVGVARGYLGRADLTAERFVPDPFSGRTGARMYRPGDLARFLPDGAMEFLGRRDGQVKLRGHRIELGEIEATLRQHPSIGDAVVLVREDVPGDQRLAAYVVPHAGMAADAGDVRAFLQQRLPGYMVPASFTSMETLPLTPNGKVDRKALAAPMSAASGAALAPRSGTEELVASIWASVLRTERFGLHDAFFDLGGHSLLATQVVSRVREAFGLELPIATLFEAPTVAGLSERIQALRAKAMGEPPPPPLRTAPHEGPQPLSFAQQRLWFLYRMEPESPVYNMPAVLRLSGALDADVARRCLDALRARHESLRTTFLMHGQTPAQVVAPVADVPLEVIDLTGLPVEQREAEARRRVDEEARRPFALERSPGFRCALVRLGEHEHLLLLTLHHIIADGWSLSVLVREVAALYASFSAGQPSALSPLPVQYADYARWQREWLSGAALERQLSYWKERLAGAPPFLELPADHPRPPVQGFRGTTHQGPLLAREEAEALRALCRREGATPFMAVMAAFQVLLHRYTGETDLVVGTDIANRNHLGTEGLIGFFINQLVMRGDLSGDPTFRALLRQTRRTALEAYAHQDLPFEELVKAVNPERSVGYSPVFQVKLILQNAPGSDLELPGLVLKEEASTTNTARFDMTWVVTETEHGLECLCEYSTDLYARETIARMREHLGQVLASAVARPEEHVSRLALLPEAERHRLLVEWNDTAVSLPEEALAHRLFEAQVARTPDAVAVSFEGRELRYRELDARANQLAGHLRGLGVGPEVRVGLCLERSPELVVGLLAILKAGGAWLPLDPTLPMARLGLMMRDAGVPVVITQEHLADELPIQAELLVCLDSEADAKHIARQPVVPPSVALSPDHLAYVIFTSGSTGKPKGTLLTHRGLCNTALAAVRAHRIQPDSRVLQFAAISFDASVCEVFSALLAGARLCLAPRDALMPGAPLQGLLVSQGITVATLTPSVLARLDPAGLPGLASVISAGEACTPELARQWVVGRHFVNAYGPTEVTVCASAREQVDAERPDIGRAWPNVRLYVLDAEGRPVPTGVPGELFIGGVGVARGYLGRPELTAERFVPDALSGTQGARLYRTGDRVRWLADGHLEFLGRTDFQVKLRGFRIELGEVEAALAELPEVREAAVAVREEAPGRRQLVAWIVPVDEEAPDTAALRRALEARLPDYMVPSAFISLKALPLTSSGKVDRRALASEVQQQPQRAQDTYVAPRTAVERTLTAIWSAVLSRERVGIHDNFFELGGDSIVSIQVIARAQEAGLRITPRQFFQHQTIAALAPHVSEAQAPRGEQGVVTGPVPLTPIQQWFFESRRPEPHHYNQSLLLGLRERPSQEALRDALTALVAHHDALRLRFEETPNGWRQENAALADATRTCAATSYTAPGAHPPPDKAHASQAAATAQPPSDAAHASEQQTSGTVIPTAPAHAVELRGVDLSALDAAAQREALEAEARKVQAGFDLTRAPLMAAVLFDLGPRGTRLLLAVHHLVVDAVSWRVLLQDLGTAYQQLLRGDAVSLPAKTTSFQEWARRLEALAQGPELAEEAATWLRQGLDVPPLPLDLPGGDNTLASARTVSVALATEETRALLHELPKSYRARIDEVLLTALVRALSAWTGHRLHRVQWEGHGREELFEDVDLSRTVGWFTSIYPVTVELPPVGTPGDGLRAVRDALRRIPRKGLGHGLLRYLRQDSLRTKLEASPEPQVAFNYLGQLDSALPSDSPLVPADEPIGAQQSHLGLRRQVLEVNAHVLEGRLEVSLTYSEALHHRSTLEALAQGYLHALRELMAGQDTEDAKRLSPSDFPLADVTQATLDTLLRDHPGLEDLYPLSPMQQGMLFHARLEPRAGVYFERAAWTLDTDLNAEALRLAWRETMERHPILRTSFAWEGMEEPHQLVHGEARLPWEEADWRGLSADPRKARQAQWMQEDEARGFDLERAPLMRVAVLRLGERTWRVVWSFHHLLLDGWSVGRVLNEVLARYDAKLRRETPTLEAPPLFRDYIAWLRERGTAKAETWWRQELAGFTEPTPVPCEQGGQARSATPVMGARKVLVPEDATERLRVFSRRHQVTLGTLVQAAWALVLGRHASSEDVLFGVTVAGRPPELGGVEQMVGLFINTVPARVRLPASKRVVDWLKELQAAQVERAPHESAPLVRVQGWSQVPRGTSLFETLLVFENYPVEQSVMQGSSALEVRDVNAQERTHYPLTLTAHADKELLLLIDFESPRLDERAVEQLLEQLATALVNLCASETRALGDVSILTEAARHRLLVDWNDTHAPLAADACVHEHFEAQARKTPDAVAVSAPGGASLTYGQLEEQSNRLAHHLRARGVGPEVLVGVYLERTPELYVALLGILKAGGAYVPLDPAYPSERVALMVSEARLSWLITQRTLEASLGPSDVPRYLMDGEAPARERLPTVPPPRLAGSGTLAYVVFTSGSTGTPKGVMVSHRSWANAYLGWEQGYGLRDEGCRNHLQMASFSFDVFAGDLVRALLSGGRLVLCPREWLLEPARLYALLRDEDIHCAEFVPAVARGLLQHLEETGQRLDRMRAFVAGSDAWYVDEYHRLRGVIGDGTRLINSYGISETTIDSTWFESDGLTGAESRLVPIGRPFANVRVHVLDARHQPVPVGVVGELFIAGEGVARGYRLRPELTAERFVPDPFGAPGSRLYRSGDRARWLPDGNLEFLGRADTQVKLRGFRVELAEIESVLGKAPSIESAVVLLRQDPGTPARLVAYVVGAGGQDVSALRDFVRARLPDYMVPALFLRMEALPLTPNGKVDRRALPVPDAGLRAVDDPLVAPRTETEAALLAIWREVLGLESLGVMDDFFAVGGHSLLATRILSRANAAFEVDLPLRALFEHTTVAGLAERIILARLEAVDEAALASLLDEVDGLSDEEAALLAEGSHNE